MLKMKILGVVAIMGAGMVLAGCKSAPELTPEPGAGNDSGQV